MGVAGGGIGARRRRPSPVWIAGRYVRVLVGEFKWTLVVLACAVVLGSWLHWVGGPGGAGRPVGPRLGFVVYAAWMALFAQPVYSPPAAWYLMVMYAVYPVLGFMLVGEGVVRLAL